jgi:heme O synthase-like polyprenyltransferase
MKKIFKFKSRNLRKYAFEFLSIFIAVIAAFALNNWNDNRKDRIAESKILTEISNGLELD